MPISKTHLKNIPSRLRARAINLQRRYHLNSRKRHTLRRLSVNSISPTQASKRETILFFSPEAGVSPHLAAQCVLGRTLQEKGYRVLFVRCFDVFPRCPVRDMYQQPYSLPFEVTTQTCLDCVDKSFEMLGDYQLENLSLRDFLTPELKTKYQQALQNVPDDLRLFEYESVAIGKICINDLALSTKVFNFDEIDEATRLAWMSYIKSCLLSYLLVDEICKKFAISRFIHFNDYSLLLGGRLAARKHHIPSYTVTQAAHNSVDRRRYLILPKVVWDTFGEQLESWPIWRELALSAEQVKEVADDLLTRLNAKNSHTYSPAKTFDTSDVRSIVGLAKDKKLLVAYTSSLDEATAGRMLREGLGLPTSSRRQPFVDQIEWLRSLTQYVMRRDDLQLVVRIHPREGLNKRDSVSSMHLVKLKEAFEQPLANCHFVWPEDSISSYDLGEAADLVLTSWSTIGLELARLGVPVLTSTNGISPFPHDDFLEWGETSEIYFQKLEVLLNQNGAKLETLIRAFRWYNLFHLGTSINLGDIVPAYNFDELPDFKLPIEAKSIERIIIDGVIPLSINLERQNASQSRNVIEESASIAKQLRRLIHFIYTGEECEQDFQLTLIDIKDDHNNLFNTLNKSNMKARTLITHGQHTRYFDGERLYQRFSPMCKRLAPLCAQQVQTTSLNSARF